MYIFTKSKGVKLHNMKQNKIVVRSNYFFYKRQEIIKTVYNSETKHETEARLAPF